MKPTWRNYWANQIPKLEIVPRAKRGKQATRAKPTRGNTRMSQRAKAATSEPRPDYTPEEFQNGCFTLETNKNILRPLHQRNLKTQQLQAILDLCLGKTRVGEYHDYCNVIVFRKAHKKLKPAFSNSSGLKSIFEKLRFCDGWLAHTVRLTGKYSCVVRGPHGDIRWYAEQHCMWKKLENNFVLYSFSRQWSALKTKKYFIKYWYQRIYVQPNKKLVVRSGSLQVNAILDGVIDNELEII